MNTISRRTAISSVVIALGALAACSSGVPDTIKIGVAQPMSGDLADLGKDMLQGVQLAVNQLNKQGFKVKGKVVTLEVVSVDDKAESEEAKKVAQQLVDAGVVAVVGHLNSGESIATAPIYAAKGIAQLAISTNPQFAELGHATTLRLVANDNLQARAVGSYAAGQLTGTKFAVIDEGTVYGKGLAEAAAKQLEGKKTIALRQSFDDKTKEFGALAEKLKADGIQVVVSTLNDFQLIALIDALVKNGYNKQITVLGTDTIKTAEMVKHANKVAAMYATSPILEPSEFPGGKAFLEAYQAAYKSAPAYAGHYGYDAMYVIAAAIKRAESADPKKITETLHKLDNFAPVSGSMKWDAKGEQRYGTVGVYSVRGGKWESQMRSDNW
jgi:branched-chain amino acid transport system substrate-binding protein